MPFNFRKALFSDCDALLELKNRSMSFIEAIVRIFTEQAGVPIKMNILEYTGKLMTTVISRKSKSSILEKLRTMKIHKMRTSIEGV